jgi:zinc protease
MLDRITPPPSNRSTSFDLIQPTKITLSNGVLVYFIGGGSQDVLKLDIIFKAGRWFENQWGLSYFTSNLVTKGTASKTSFEIAQIFDLYGAHLEVTSGLDYVTLSLYSLTSKLESSLVLLLEILSVPSFPEKELQQSKSIYLQNLKVNQEKTSFLASKLIRKNIFGEQHPYGKELDENDVESLAAKQIKDFYNSFFSDFQVMVSGKIDDKIQSQIIKSLSSLSQKAVNEITNSNVVIGSKHQMTEKEGSVQASVRMGKRSVLRSHKDYVDVLFLNHIFGGFFGSRLMKNIREEKGLTYGIYSALHAMKHDSYMVIGADVNKENRVLIFEEIRSELRRLCNVLIDNEELDTARYHFIGSLQAEITTPFAHADKIRNILTNNLDQQYYTSMIERIDSITAVELLETANKYFEEDSYIEVAVG